MDEAFIQKYIDQIAKVRNQDPTSLVGYKNVMMGALVGEAGSRDNTLWASNQVHIALGNFLTTAALFKVDTCALGGIVSSKYDEILGLKGTGWTTVVACASGYRSNDDKYATAPKVRFEREDLIVKK